MNTQTTDHGPQATDHGFNGIALVAVLAILVVLAIMASTFTVLMNIENKQSASQINSQQLDMLIGSGLEHAKSILTINNIDDSLKNVVLNENMPFNSKWISDTELEYQMPDGEKKIYRFNEQ